jgi:hypothetical protein
MSDTILVYCSAVAVARQPDYSILVGRFNLYYSTTNIWLRSYRLTQKNRRHYVQNAPHRKDGEGNKENGRKSMYHLYGMLFHVIWQNINILEECSASVLRIKK